MSNQSKWRQLPTEAVNPATANIDTLPLAAVIDLMMVDNIQMIEALQREKEAIVRGAAILVRALEEGGRLIFVGAGTSGRLGVLEAAEMPPTFGLSSGVVVSVMAGGKPAVHRAKEGVEDNQKEGGRAIDRLRPASRDAVIGISASGVTPFVRGAMIAARRAGCRTVGITCHAQSELREYTDAMISLGVGPEVIAGSTRLKAGTATKIVLNMLTTSAMIRIGKVYGNMMVDVQSHSAKLRDRGTRIVSAVTGLSHDRAGALLRRARWNVKTAIVMQKAGLSRPKALERLRAARDSVRRAIEEG